MSTNPPLNTLATLLAAREIQGTRVSFGISEDWKQGRTIYGGVLAALTTQAMRDLFGADWPLRALQTNFVSPVEPGPVHIDVSLLRQGKNVRQVKAVLSQVDAQGVEQVCGVLLGVFGSGRISQVRKLRPEQHSVPVTAEASVELPYMPGLTPHYTQHMDYRLAAGAFPFSGSDCWETSYHLKLRYNEGVDSELMTIMLIDAGPTPSMSQVMGFAPGCSLSWALELRTVEETDPAGLWRLDQETVAYGDGYSNDRAHLWTPDGQLAALGYQVVALYA